MTKLDCERAMDEKTLIDVGVALCAVDRLCGVDDSPSGKKDSPTEDYGDLLNQMKGKLAKKTTTESASSKKTLKSAWMKWAMEYYTFNMLVLTKVDLASLSDAVKEFLFSEADLVASSGAGSEEIDRADREKNILPSLKYFFPAVPKPNEKAKPLTADQKAQNVIFMRELRKVWFRAREDLNNAVVEFVAKGIKAQRSAQEKQEKVSKEGGHGGGYDMHFNKDKMSLMLENMCLHDLSLKRLRNWIEEDEDKKLAKENEDALEKLKLAKTSHEQFVKKKDSLRIRMPDDMVAPPPPAMTYGKEISAVKAEKAGPKTTVELMAGSGLKYVHATSKGRQGMEGDLERSRNQLLKIGYVSKENFESEDRERFEKEKRENTVLREREMMGKKLREESTKAYDDWVKTKELRDQAVKCLSYIPKPNPAEDNSDMNSSRLRRSTTSVDSYKTSTKLYVLITEHKEMFDHVVDVGKALKSVDRTLFFDWAKWCESVLSINTCQVLWDYFDPRACDVHSAAFSQVRDTFLKLLRPGVDYKQTFVDFVERSTFRRRIENFKQEKRYYRLEPEEQQEVDQELEGLKKEWMQTVSISKHQLKTLLKQMGIVLKEGEMRSLVDAFDANGDGVVTLKEFLDFIGPKRDKRSGISTILGMPSRVIYVSYVCDCDEPYTIDCANAV
ncbi:hypothetical protein EON65_42810 [archaeon]|nr:MAG: hypothetical protein EON65_42810 [archaeon]